MVSRPLPPMPVAALGPPVLVPLGTLVRRARVMLLGSAGVHLSMLGAIQRLRLPYKRAASSTFAAGGNTAALWLRIEVVWIEQHATATRGLVAGLSAAAVAVGASFARVSPPLLMRSDDARCWA